MLARVKQKKDEFLATPSLDDGVEDTDVRDLFVRHLNASLAATRVYRGLYEQPLEDVDDTLE